jgi:hypothetical protein
MIIRMNQMAAWSNQARKAPPRAGAAPKRSRARAAAWHSFWLMRWARPSRHDLDCSWVLSWALDTGDPVVARVSDLRAGVVTGLRAPEGDRPGRGNAAVGEPDNA